MIRQMFDTRAAVFASHLLGAIADLPAPRFLLRPLISLFVKALGVDLRPVAKPPGGFRSFGAFFGRQLLPGARPLCPDPAALLSPCDGIVVGAGAIDRVGGEGDLAVKGQAYDVASLVADRELARALDQGGHCILYLHPRDYHRVHVPTAARLRAVRHIPGARYPMARWATAGAGEIYGKNERVVFELVLAGGAICVLVMVAAFGVGGITCPQVPDLPRSPGRVWRFPEGVRLEPGAEIGSFRLGSTVVLLWPRGAVELDAGVEAGSRVRVGARLGRLPVQKAERYS